MGHFDEIDNLQYTNRRAYNDYRVTFLLNPDNSNIGFYDPNPIAGLLGIESIFGEYCLNSLTIEFNSYWEAGDFFKMVQEAIKDYGAENAGLDFVTSYCVEESSFFDFYGLMAPKINCVVNENSNDMFKLIVDMANI